ncbi:MAG: ABC transporter permease subunit [Candidatus Thorarchaeota archaeon]|nr:ABC transporter permease subunit [Candidatus Thorarchaeota archaeon]
MKRPPENLREIWELEFNQFYSFPVVEGIVAIFLAIAFASTIGIFGSHIGVYIEPGATWNGTAVIESVSEYRWTITASAYASSALGFGQILAFLIPLFLASTLAGRFEDGTLQTYLSYPIQRSTLLMVKVSGVIVVLGTVATFASFSMIFLFIPGSKDAFSILLVTSALWAFIMLLASGTTLISIATRNGAATAIIGIILWYAAQMIAGSQATPSTVRAVLNPISLASNYVAGGLVVPQITEVYVGIVGAMIIGVLGLAASVFLFEKVEI